VPDLSFAWARAFVVVAGLAILAGRAIYDIAVNGREASRAKEYAFLLLTMFAAVAYGIVHDHLTATISPEYFLVWKGLSTDPRPWRVAVTFVAVRSSWWAGLLVGACFLLANNPNTSGRRRLRFGELARFALLPLGAAVMTAAACGAVNVLDPFGLAAGVEPLVARSRLGAFMFVWGIHFGSYAGALVGGAWATWRIVATRRGFSSGETAAGPA
jgi:hypothetical protein